LGKKMGEKICVGQLRLRQGGNLAVNF